MNRLTSPPVLFLAAGIVFAAAGLFTSRVAEPGIDVLINKTYFVILNIHMHGIAAMICVSYSALYYAIARGLRLTLNKSLALVQFAITLLALVGLANQRYLGLGNGQSPTYNSLIGWLTINAAVLLLVSAFLFFAILFLASALKFRRRIHI